MSVTVSSDALLCDARCTLADSTPQLGPGAVGSANVNGFRPSIGCRGLIRRYAFTVPTGVSVRIARHSVNVNGVPTQRRMALSRLA